MLQIEENIASFSTQVGSSIWHRLYFIILAMIYP